MNTTLLIANSRTLFLIVLLIASITGWGQSQHLTGYVLNENNIPVSNVSVFVNNQLKIRKTDETGFFHLNVEKNDTVSVRKDKAKDQYIVGKLIGNDTTIVIFQLFNKSFLLEEITLTGSRVKKIDGEKNERVVDYYVYPDESFITIKEFENNYFLDLFVSGSPKQMVYTGKAMCRHLCRQEES